MSESVLGPGPRTRVRRLPQKATHESATVEAILDEARFCHVAAVVDGRAVTLPTLHAREGRTLYLHGSQSNALMRAVVDAGQVCVSVMLYDGLRLARSGFESSIAYRSVVIFGSAQLVNDEAEKRRVLDLFVDAILPGRAAEVRAASDREIRLTMVVGVHIDEASAKLSSGPTDDDEQDLELPIWSGTVPAHVAFAAPIPSSDGAMAGGTIEVPASVTRLTKAAP